ncbi:hypothetical protein AAG906_010290 [Vitis piasezkii]
MGFKPVEFEDSPTLKDAVTVADYLIRYDAIPATSGVVSRTEELLYLPKLRNSPKMKEEYIENLCMQILKFKLDLVITERGLSDLACRYSSKAGVNAIRRLRKAANNRVAKACGAVVVNRPDGLQESDVLGWNFEVEKIRDEFFAFINECTDPKTYTVLLRGASEVHLNEVERNLLDAMSVARNIIKIPKLVPGGVLQG